MIRIAIVEDENSAADKIKEFILRYGLDTGVEFNISRFTDGISFITNYKAVFDIILMDIEMPNMNGMEAARGLRKLDEQTVLIFVTNMAQFAVKGYEVDALDFIVKPVSYPVFALKMKKAVAIVDKNTGSTITITQAANVERISTKDLLYIDVQGHLLRYHLKDKVIDGWGNLTEIENKLSGSRFMRCNRCYLVNPRHIKSVKGFIITLSNGDEVQISRPQKKKFYTDLAEWLGEGNE